MNKKSHIEQSLDKGIRIDGRGLEDYRPIEIKTNVSATAEGSAKVKIGETEVIVGVKLQLGTPFPDTPEDGILMVGAELIPMSSPDFESGPPSIDAIELARLVDRGIREGKAIDTKKLCIKKGELVWMVEVDVIPINASGNLFDAASLGTIIALKNTKLPKLEEDRLNYKEKTDQGLPISSYPLSVTVIKIGNNLITDPLPEEEKVIDARLTVAATEDGKLCAMQKGGDCPLTTEDIDKMITLGLNKIKELRKFI